MFLVKIKSNQVILTKCIVFWLVLKRETVIYKKKYKKLINYFDNM